MLNALGGLLKHAKALCAVHAPTVNSYKRLVIGRSQSGTTWAPAHIAYGYNNRTCVARSLAGRFEWRLPDPSTNVYLAIAGVIAAIVDGLENCIAPPESIDADLYEWTQEGIVAAGIETLPQNLGEAVAAFKENMVLQRALGTDVSQQFIELKQTEWNEYARHVSEWELKQYAFAF
jgi:glutamine synthetase